MEPEKIIEVPELGITSQFMEELRGMIANKKYDHLSVADLVGALEMIKIEYLTRWMNG